MRYSSRNLFGYAVFTLTLQLNGCVEAGASCKDLQGRSYETGFHYIPGPEPCTLCVCENGNPKWCKAVICTFPQETLPKQDCKSFRFGNTCCEFICMDDTLSSVSNDKTEGEGTTIAEGNANYDTGLRLVASCITAVLSLSLLFFLIHRLRQRKIRVCVAGRQTRQVAEDQRSLGSMGYLERGGLQHGVPMDDMPCGGGYPLWKPPGNYFPRGEAPPPYDEAVAAARAEQVLLSTSPHALSPSNFPSTYLTSHNSNSSMPLVTNSQNGLPVSSPTLSSNHGASTSPLIPPPNRPLSSPGTHSNCYQLNQSESASTGLYAGTSTTSFTMGTNTYENLPAANISSITPQHSVAASNMLLLPTSHSTTPKTYHHHTTLPRQGGAFTISATLPNSGGATHRTIPRSLATTGSLRLRREFLTHQPIAPLFDAPAKCTSPRNSPRSAPPSLPISDDAIRSDALYEDVLVSKETTVQIEGKPPEVTPLMCNYKPTLAVSNDINQDGSFDSVTCTCSMQALPTLHDDADDYRSECENCKSATGSRYYLDNEDELVTSPHETMTLQRRPEETTSSTTPQYYRTSLTLPTSTRQRTRSTGNRGNWFSSMPESSTESSDGE
ncbi:uncharacterized protein LOC117178951 isoform X1 [Belonocnema kinseyi]|uniref:uncharacterized protein LOC117178951 isoform X1 n=1 Tax=Belonocnema kinseyi TaxID=2817044 RepID=UPI00143DCDCE|nr:uncharacterized protein LOC117178951 isoform X1 [Belonocnema kinseyi]